MHATLSTQRTPDDVASRDHKRLVVGGIGGPGDGSDETVDLELVVRVDVDLAQVFAVGQGFRLTFATFATSPPSAQLPGYGFDPSTCQLPV